MSRKRIWNNGVGLWAAGAALLALAPAALAGGGWCDHCPPPFKHCYEGPPRICFKKACPKPVCDPCTLEHWGYFQNCWHPWPWPPDWSHCPVPPSGALVPSNCSGYNPVPTVEPARPMKTVMAADANPGEQTPLAH